MGRIVPQRVSSVFVAFLLVFCATLAILDLARAQTPPTNSGQRQVYLIRQDSSDCTNSTVSNTEGPQLGGYIWIVRNPDGTTSVKVAMTASPSTTYHVYLKCFRQLGDLTTGEEGAGIENFSFPTSLTNGNVYAFDIYPEGAPLGNKFQSVQVVFN